ncbi:MAG: dihydrodipicolinate synthase family protein [Opitutaceae bacterium]|nr:dihydrodipicolinate synthase family protein [Opitutaceae bacterium]
MPPTPALDGIIAVPATPFTEDNRVDVESLRRYARRFLEKGAVGFLAPAVAGEVETLSEAEREQVVTTLLEESAGRVPVIGGATDPDPATRLKHARRFLALGCTGVLAYVRYEDDASYAAAIHELGRLAPPFLMIQDMDLGPRPLPVPLLARLHREVPCLTWAKVETGDRGRKITALREAAGPTLKIGTAGPDVIELLDRGADAYLPTLYLDIYDRIWRRHRAGRREEASDLHRRLLPCLSFMATHQKIQWHFTKALLHAEGIFATTRVRLPIPALDPYEQRLIGELSDYALALSRRVAAERA